MTTTTTTTPTTTTPATNGTTQQITPLTDTADIVAGIPQTGNQINIADATGQMASDPSLALSNSELLADNTPTISSSDVNAGLINGASSTYQDNPTQDNTTASTVGSTSTVDPNSIPQNTQAASVTTALSQPAVDQAAMTAANGTVNSNDLVDANAADIDTSTYDQTAAGQALQQYASQNISNIIDTSTASGQLLAAQLGDGNYIDSKATLEGQLALLQSQFTDANGQPTIPAWAAGTARNVSRIAAFTGMTGTAATAAMAQAIMEASLPIAQQDSQFFQTVTMTNLSDKQQAVINNANVLSKIDLANMSNQMQAQVTNAQNFMQMDMSNLSNDQQAAMVNTQAQVQSILADTNATNTDRLAVAQSQDQKDQFYSQLDESIQQYNSSQLNSMSQFNATQQQSTDQFNSDLENNRQQFYQNMQFGIDTANTKWRQTVTLQNNTNQFNAAATDVKNLVGVQTEALNQIWDRSDSLLQDAFTASQNDADRANQINLVKLQNNQTIANENATGTGNIIGTLLGVGGNLLLNAFGA